MSVTERFEDFFEAANRRPDGVPVKPHRWQLRVVAEVARTGRWPDISVPTGAGKSSVVDMHVFLVAEHAGAETLGLDAERIARPPRRLVLVAPRRVLVDDQFERALRLAQLLSEAVPDSVLGAVAERLRSLRSAHPDDESDSPLGVWRLRGGLKAENGWRLDPSACQIICSTPQMWGSRLLFRGYGASPRARNLETGLLSYDAATIIDEVHLHERLFDTGRRIAKYSWGSRRLQVVGMSATARLGPDAIRLTSEDLEQRSDDLDSPSALLRRVQADKPVRVKEVDDLTRDGAAALTRAALDLDVDGTVGVFVNDVPTAVEVAGDLRKSGAGVVLVCGRMRPYDVVKVRADHPGLLTATGDDAVDFLVSTQSLEVGVDLDLPAMLTLIAPANALAQRAGRLNRTGERSPGTFTVVTQRGLADLDPEDSADVGRAPRSGPYTALDLIYGARWLKEVGDTISPLRVSETPLPEAGKLPLAAVRRTDIETLQMTGTPQSADPDVQFYLDEPQHRRREILIAARKHLDLSRDVVKAALELCPPREHEVVGMPLSRELEQMFVRAQEWSHSRECELWVVRWVDDELTAEIVGDYSALTVGDALIVPDGAPICTAGVVGGRRTGEPFEDVLEAVPYATELAPAIAPRSSGRGPRVPRDSVIELDYDSLSEALEIDPRLGSKAARRELATALSMSEWAGLASLVGRSRRLSDVKVHWCGGVDSAQGLLVVSDQRQRAQQWIDTPSLSTDVSIDAHGCSVEARLSKILEKLDIQISDPVRVALLLAARWHDEGKCHPKFQALMGWEPGHPPLAKPRPGYRPSIGGPSAKSWRHEQLSTAYVVVHIAAQHGLDPSVLSLAIALVGAHHGRGRVLFNRDADELLDGFAECCAEVKETATMLFGDFGRYELIREQVTRRHGAYELAWLEALLRCADMQVSKEGS